MLPREMTAAYLMGYGGLDQLIVRTDAPVPHPQPDEVLIRVTAAGVNNTDINTRTGWYNASVTSGTTADGGRDGFKVTSAGMGAWEGGLTFPRIQGADAVGRIVAVGVDVHPARIGERVVCEPYLRAAGDDAGLDNQSLDDAGFLGLERDGAFAQFVAVPAVNAFSVPDDLPVSDLELATLPCSGGTAMNMLLLGGAKAGDLALVTGASGGVGSFLVQILKALGAEVIAVASAAKVSAVQALGADHVVARGDADLAASILRATDGRRLSLVADVVGGDLFLTGLELLKRGGRCVTAGAIGGPIVAMDLRTLYLKNLSLYGSAVYRRDTFPRLLDLIVTGQLKPAVSGTWPLTQIHAAQTAFLDKTHVGNLVLIP
jgi:NADPH:quinone reductase-like Zn-dependent oxidoreductase